VVVTKENESGRMVRKAIMTKYEKVTTAVKVQDQWSDEFEVKVGGH